MVADNLLPVWTIAPNWSQPVRERLMWTRADGRTSTRPGISDPIANITIIITLNIGVDSIKSQFAKLPLH